MSLLGHCNNTVIKDDGHLRTREKCFAGSIYEIIHICTAVVDEVKSDHRSKFSNLSNWKEEA